MSGNPVFRHARAGPHARRAGALARVRAHARRRGSVGVLTFCAGDQAGDPAQAWIILGVGAVINFLGVPAGLIGNELSIRYGLRTIATLVFVLSAFAGGLFGFTPMLPYIAVLEAFRRCRLHRAG